jgi:hypothetical protein
VAGNGIAVETPAKSWVDSRNVCDMAKVAVEIPVNWIKVELLREIAGVIGVNYN